MAERSKQTARRLFRRIRAGLKKDLGIETLTGADRVLVDQAALISLRIRQMRDDILSGEKPADDEELVRLTNAATRLLSVLGMKGRRVVRKRSDEPSLDQYLADWRARKEAAGEKADASENE
jgi:hypothetical protein